MVRNLAIFLISILLLVTLSGMGRWPVVGKMTQETKNIQVDYPQGAPRNNSMTSKRSSNSTPQTQEQLGQLVKPVRVMILTRYRSGSSFVGDLFSHHPDVYYMFEPLRLVYDLKNDTAKSITWMAEITPGIMDDVYNCRFGGLFQQSIRHKEQYNRWHRAFCTQDNESTQISEYQKLCEKNSIYLPQYTSHVCKSFKHLVVKTIRLLDAAIIKRLVENNVKVIHLVRDPRGQLSSIVKLHGESTLGVTLVSDRAYGICHELTKTLDRTKELLEAYPQLRKSYLLVRYEDIALEPMHMTKELYNFAGLDFRPEVIDWVQQSTRKRDGGSYSTMRNSTAASRAWTKRLGWEKVLAIQKQCSKVLWRLGYDIMWSKDDLKTKDPVMKFPSDQLLARH